MNSDTVEIAEQIAKDVSAIVKCWACGSCIYTNDGEADRMSYAQATEAWKSGDRGFRAMSREEVMDVVKSILDDAFVDCPGCTPKKLILQPSRALRPALRALTVQQSV